MLVTLCDACESGDSDTVRCAWQWWQWNCAMCVTVTVCVVCEEGWQWQCVLCVTVVTVTLCDVCDSGDSDSVRCVWQWWQWNCAMCVTVVTADSAAASVRSHRLFIVWDNVMGLSGSEITKHALSANKTTQHHSYINSNNLRCHTVPSITATVCVTVSVLGMCCINWLYFGNKDITLSDKYRL